MIEFHEALAEMGLLLPRVQGLLGQCAERAEAPEAANLVVRMIAICKEREQRNEEVVWGI